MSGELLCVIPGPTKVVKTQADWRSSRWCFKCRKRLSGKWELLADDDTPENPSYYEPIWAYCCDGCGTDSKDFPQ